MTNRMIRALGLMSGTSLDGVDAAIIETDGLRIAGFGRSAYAGYSDNEAQVLHEALGRWPGEPGVAEAAELSVAAHAGLAAQFPEAEVLGYHGQTLAHDPAGGRTHQAGDGAALAHRLDRPVVWDFRSEDVRQGGEGAPLAPFFHWACAVWAMGQGRLPEAPVAFLNLGGVGNITFVDPRAQAPEAEGACLAFDTGPANAPVNDLMRKRLRRERDEGGALALAGRVDEAVIADFLSHPYFARVPPKSLDRDAFTALSQAVEGLSDADAAATLTEAAAAAAGAGMLWMPEPPERVLVCGGGRHNRAMMAALARRIAAEVVPVEEAGLDGDMLEAQAFGWLAVRVLQGLPTSGPGTTGVAAPVSGGRISYPRRSGPMPSSASREQIPGRAG
ncbi:anhydro-N-acetylmuramic acid kinase [Paracoccus aminophilus]|uniref:Anhydro-N-acetylmuramic acid kinase n=1 Tax=Paracoccus aminophilus JCM 7686 TaxID=1367847 RepID=S5XX03_PARAH|nr:anhydro-N-acetylmuramic acid kinase [Paracoccus aminophilus]AGT07970.1 anhydro-N-acetylmuramic acid kinase [Paracoccus aminophilus JCM 7686]